MIQKLHWGSADDDFDVFQWFPLFFNGFPLVVLAFPLVFVWFAMVFL